MRTDRLHPGDLIEAHVRGARYEARVLSVSADAVEVEPLSRWPNWRHLTARQVVKVLERGTARGRQEAMPCG